jgi:hypothetical protein
VAAEDLFGRGDSKALRVVPEHLTSRFFLRDSASGSPDKGAVVSREGINEVF